jgi:hypothetical protein
VSDNDPTVIGLVTQGLAEVKDAVSQLSRDLHSTLSRLPTDYVPRRELERRLDELTIDVGAERAARERALADLKDAADAAEAHRISSRRWLVGTSLGTALSALGVIAGIWTHFS